jgi:SAM-dependent methyltransferase
MIAPLVSLALAGSFRSLLDVGCGFGFAVNFASHVLGWDAVGVEPSPYGKAGAELLGVKIYHRSLEDVSELRGRTFDVVLSSEVLEHIADVKGFLRLLKTHLSEEGVLVLTTPNAEGIRENTQWSTLLGILSPGFHLVLFNRRGLEMALREVGFQDVRIEERAHRLVAWAALHQLSQGKDTGMDAVRWAYIRYLEDLVERRGERRDALYDGVAYRLFKERVNLGGYDEACPIGESLTSSLLTKYGAAVLEPDKACAIAEETSSFDELGERLPYNLAGVYFYLGMLNLNHTKNYDSASTLFRGGLVKRCAKRSQAATSQARSMTRTPFTTVAP